MIVQSQPAAFVAFFMVNKGETFTDLHTVHRTPGNVVLRQNPLIFARIAVGSRASSLGNDCWLRTGFNLI
jgi:hypothetical protein